jgi:hypothetical protein
MRKDLRQQHHQLDHLHFWRWIKVHLQGELFSFKLASDMGNGNSYCATHTLALCNRCLPLLHMRNIAQSTLRH